MQCALTGSFMPSPLVPGDAVVQAHGCHASERRPRHDPTDGPPRVAGCDIAEIVDLHTDAESEDKGFEELRRLSRGRGGDAVIGAEFEHGSDG